MERGRWRGTGAAPTAVEWIVRGACGGLSGVSASDRIASNTVRGVGALIKKTPARAPPRPPPPRVSRTQHQVPGNEWVGPAYCWTTPTCQEHSFRRGLGEGGDTMDAPWLAGPPGVPPHHALPERGARQGCLSLRQATRECPNYSPPLAGDCSSQAPHWQVTVAFWAGRAQLRHMRDQSTREGVECCVRRGGRWVPIGTERTICGRPVSL